MSGFIKDYRKELDSDIWLMPPLYHRVWQWIKYSVNHRAQEVPFSDGSKVLVEPGERITSHRQIAKGVGYYERGIWREPNPKTIKEILLWLEREQMIHVFSNSKYTLVKVLNWGVYQESQPAESNGQETARKQSLDTNKNEKNEKNEKKRDIPYQDIVDLYHNLCPAMSRVIKLSTSRKAAIKARHNEHGMDGLINLFTKTGASSFLTGTNDRGWKADFDWLIKESNCLKVLEGRYDNPPLEKREKVTRADFTYAESNQDRSQFTWLDEAEETEAKED